MANGAPRRPPNLWAWLLAVALLALIAWSVGQTVAGRAPEPEIGVGDEPVPGRRPPHVAPLAPPGGPAVGERSGPPAGSPAARSQSLGGPPPPALDATPGTPAPSEPAR
jgi:hypothetical protein